MEVQAAGVLVANAEFPGAGDFTFDGEVALLCITVLEIARDGQGEGENGQREASGQIILIGKERTGGERIKALLVRKIKHAGQLVQDALENRGAIQIGGLIQAVAAGGVSRGGTWCSCGKKSARGRNTAGA